MSTRQSGVALVSTGVTFQPFDNFTMTLSAGDTTETYKFYRNSTQVSQWVLVYTDSGRSVLVSGAYTDLA